MRQDILLRHAARRLPRYTSYPTAPHFTADVDEGVAGRWLAGLPPREALSLYLHVPFCRELCWYCGCHTKATRQDEPIARYAATLTTEIDNLAARLPGRMRVSHLHWGGGSPTSLGPHRLVALMDLLRRRFDVLADAEVAIEIDPRHFTPTLAGALRHGGFNRASLGVQTFDPRVQAAVNRVQSADVVAHAVERLRNAGVAGVNVDLLYGLPLQTARSCRRTVSAVLDLAPDRLAVFGYAHVPHMAPHQTLIDAADLPDAPARLRQADAIAEELVGAGYRAIGIDHFARPGDPLAQAQAAGTLRRNFQGYTADSAGTLLGLGASAIGSLPDGYVQNVAAVRDWERRVTAGSLPVVRGRQLSGDDRLRRDIIERLMCDLAADVPAIAARHGLPVPDADLREFVAGGAVTLDAGVVTVGPAYRPLVRAVAAAFDAYLPRSTARHSLAV